MIFRTKRLLALSRKMDIMNKISIYDISYEVGTSWINLSVSDRIKKIEEITNSYQKYGHIKVQDVFDNGHVILRIEESIPANERGLFLLDLEEKIKEKIDQGITIWLEPVGDKSKLRQLRGVEIKS